MKLKEANVPLKSKLAKAIKARARSMKLLEEEIQQLKHEQALMEQEIHELDLELNAEINRVHFYGVRRAQQQQG